MIIKLVQNHFKCVSNLHNPKESSIQYMIGNGVLKNKFIELLDFVFDTMPN